MVEAPARRRVASDADGANPDHLRLRWVRAIWRMTPLTDFPLALPALTRSLCVMLRESLCALFDESGGEQPQDLHN